MELFSLFGTTIEYDDVVNTLKERDYIGSGDRYIREYSVKIKPDSDLDKYNEIWQLPEHILCQFKEQSGNLRTAFEDLTSRCVVHTHEVDDVPKPEVEPKPKSAVNKVRGAGYSDRSPQYRQKRPSTKTPPPKVTVKRSDFRCSDIRSIDDISQKLLTHQIHIAGEIKTEDPTQQKFTQRAGIFYKTFTCPQIFDYLRNNTVKGRYLIDTCYAKRQPYRLAEWASERNYVPHIFGGTSGKTTPTSYGEFEEIEEGVYRAEYRPKKTHRGDWVPPGIPWVEPTFSTITIRFRPQQDDEEMNSGEAP